MASESWHIELGRGHELPLLVESPGDQHTAILQASDHAVPMKGPHRAGWGPCGRRRIKQLGRGWASSSAFTFGPSGWPVMFGLAYGK